MNNIEVDCFEKQVKYFFLVKLINFDSLYIYMIYVEKYFGSEVFWFSLYISHKINIILKLIMIII